jgi:hypothetical protein
MNPSTSPTPPNRRGRPRMSDEQREIRINERRLARQIYYREYYATHPEYRENKNATKKLYREKHSTGNPRGRPKKITEKTDP